MSDRTFAFSAHEMSLKLKDRERDFYDKKFVSVSQSERLMSISSAQCVHHHALEGTLN